MSESMSESMSDEQWAIVRQQIDKLTTWLTPAKEHAEIIGLLADEVERLRKRDAEQRQKMWQYAIQNDLMRNVVSAVAEAESYHAETVDVWALVFPNPSLSYVQTILREAREALEQINGDK